MIMKNRNHEEIAEMLSSLGEEVRQLLEELKQQCENRDEESKSTSEKITLICGKIQALQWVLGMRDKLND